MTVTKITSNMMADGAVTDAKIGTLAATKLTGTIAPARLGSGTASSTTVLYGDGTFKNEPVTDISSLRTDILNLALGQTVTSNRVAYNLNDQFIDTFEDTSGVASSSTAGRDSTNEAYSSVYTVVTDTSITLGLNNYATYIDTRAAGGVVNRAGDGDFDYSGGSASDEMSLIGDTYTDADLWSSNSAASNWGVTVPAAAQDVCIILVFKDTVTFKPNGNQIARWQDGSGYMSNFRLNGVSSDFTGTALVTWDDNGTPNNGTTYTQSVTQSTFFSALAITWTCNGNSNGSKQDSLSFAGVVKSSATSNNAAGNIISDTQTASASTTSVSGAFLYTDISGTNTVGTDLKIYFTANNGTNWHEASSYGTAQVFSASTKLVQIPATTVTSGTQVAMKAVWANQASGSKVAQLNGWAVNY